MPTNKPNTKSADFIAMEPFWTQANDIVDGKAAIIDGGPLYLPKFPGETDADYEFRRKTAKFTNVYRDILEGLTQRPFAQEVAISEDAPTTISDLVEDIDGRGNHLHVFAADTFFDGVNKAIDWILVDYTKAEGLRTVEEEKLAGVRPYWVHIPADKVINIESKIVDGREQLTNIRIEESKHKIREYERIPGAIVEGERLQDSVVWRVHEENIEKDLGSGKWVVTDSGVITIGVIPMVPFITGRRKGKSWQFAPPMRDAADLQIELYQQEVALKHIKTLAGFPMLAGNGVSQPTDSEGKPAPLSVGPLRVLYAPVTGSEGQHGEWKWLSPDPAILKFLAEDIKSTIRELREIGRQPLTAQSGNITKINSAVSAQKGNSAVQQWALGLKDALENAWALTALWLVVPFKTEVKVHTDFGVDELDTNSPEQLQKARDKGDISQETLWEEFKRRGILSAEFDPEEELERLLKEIPGDDLPVDDQI